VAKTVALDPRTLAWARERFARYYADVEVEPPDRFPRREFAAFPFTEQTLMRRHASFRAADEFRAYLAREAPRHVYYSSAYYTAPDHPTMAQKGWLGADVIFDLDADHLRGAETLDYPAQLRRVKDRVRDLYDEFLRGDFGIPEAMMSLVFSGGRGYHVHVHDPAYLSLTSPERRELVEYIQGTGVDPTDAIAETHEGGGEGSAEGGDGSARPARVRTFRQLHDPATPGWRGRITRSLQAMLEHWDAVGVDATRAELEALGLAPGVAASLAKSLVTRGRGVQIRDRLTLEVFAKRVPPAFLSTVLAQAAIVVQGETDAPVTTDIHRLIRLPNSRHGGTGLRVAPLSRGDLDAFDPWRDAVPPSGGRTATVELVDAVDYPFVPDPVRGRGGDRITVAEAAAVFLVLRGEARLPPGSG